MDIYFIIYICLKTLNQNPLSKIKYSKQEIEGVLGFHDFYFQSQSTHF